MRLVPTPMCPLYHPSLVLSVLAWLMGRKNACDALRVAFNLTREGADIVQIINDPVKQWLVALGIAWCTV
eukprot:m.97336 g.97336  ORF g.97336 m.97336 type:complete len:70 (-) comp10208_c0_seq3:100-309(-)